MSHVVLYGKADCPLCDEMKDVIEQVRRERPFTLEVVDIERDAALVAALRARHSGALHRRPQSVQASRRRGGAAPAAGAMSTAPYNAPGREGGVACR